MNEELREHWKKSGFTKTVYAEKIGISRRRLTSVFEKKCVLKPATYENYLAVYKINTN